MTMKTHWKTKLWKYATILVVVLLMLNPEMLALSLFIDGIGLEMFFMLLEVQALTILAAFFNERIRPLLNYVKYFCLHQFQALSSQGIKLESGSFLLITPGPVILMHLLVFAAAIGIVFNIG